MNEERLPTYATPPLALCALTMWAHATGHTVVDHEQLGPIVDVSDDPLFVEKDLPLGCGCCSSSDGETVLVYMEGMAVSAREPVAA